MAIDFKRPEYKTALPKWTLINDLCDSENLGTYIVPINPSDESDQNIDRNTEFKQRAVFTAVAGFTSHGLVGLVFSKDPEFEVPPGLDYLKKNADGTGVSIYQQSQDVTKQTVRVGRVGLWVDYPVTQEPASKADLVEGKVFSTIIAVPADQIINWRTVRVGAKVKLSLVVILTSEEKVGEDGYTIEFVPVIRELFLTDNVEGVILKNPIYGVREWVQTESEWTVRNEYYPKDGTGQNWDEIPFIFVGAESNTWTIQQAPMYKIAKLNEAHYNNSAIYEDSVFSVGQVQPWASGLSVDNVREMLNSDPPFYIGSGQLFPIPAGEQFGFAQPEPNSLAKEAMDNKEKQMIALGAMFIQPGSAVKTATQSEGEQRVQHSVLSLIAANVSEAYTQALQWVARFMRVTMTQDHQFKLNQEYVKPVADAQMLTAVIADFMQGSMPIADFYEWKRKHGFTTRETLEEFSEEVSIQPGDLGLDDEEGRNGSGLPE